MVSGLLHRPFDQRLDLRRDGGGEEAGLPFARARCTMRRTSGKEAHVEHAIRFVEDEKFDVVELAVALLHVIEQTAGRGDEDIHAVLRARVCLP